MNIMLKQLYNEWQFKMEVNKKIDEYYQEKPKILFCKRAEKVGSKKNRHERV